MVPVFASMCLFLLIPVSHLSYAATTASTQNSSSPERMLMLKTTEQAGNEAKKNWEQKQGTKQASKQESKGRNRIIVDQPCWFACLRGKRRFTQHWLNHTFRATHLSNVLTCFDILHKSHDTAQPFQSPAIFYPFCSNLSGG